VGSSAGAGLGKIEVRGAGYQAFGASSSDASGVQVALAANSSSEARLNVVSNHPLLVYTNNAERMRIDSAGNVGIGTNTPTDKLHVASGASTYIRTQNTGASIDAYYGVSGVGAWTGTGTNHPYLFHTSNTERMRIDSSGNLLVGTASLGNTHAYFERSSVDRAILNLGTSSTLPSLALVHFRTPNGVIGSIAVSSTTTAYNTSSDYRLKHDIEPMTGALAKVQQLKPVTYKWNADDSESQGFIAHELQEVVPECVTGEKDAVDANGNPQYQGIDTSFLSATLTAALQEAHGLIKDLQARVDALEAK
jgi:hypothetical protein